MEVYGRCDPCLREDPGQEDSVPCAPAMADHIRASQV